MCRSLGPNILGFGGIDLGQGLRGLSGGRLVALTDYSDYRVFTESKIKQTLFRKLLRKVGSPEQPETNRAKPFPETLIKNP